MSQKTGDKARFHRERKAHTLRRKRTRELREQLELQRQRSAPTQTSPVPPGERL
jgi:hypothetical protein